MLRLFIIKWRRVWGQRNAMSKIEIKGLLSFLATLRNNDKRQIILIEFKLHAILQ